VISKTISIILGGGGGFKISSPIFQIQQFREFAIEYNITVKRNFFLPRMK